MSTTSRLVLAIVALAVAGCGEEDTEQQPLSKPQYQAALLDILGDRSAPTAHFGDLVVGPRSTDACGRLIRQFHGEVDRLVERVGALDPPADVASIQDDFVTAARESVDRVGEISDDVEAGEVPCGQELNDLLYGMPSSDEALAAISRLENRGYYVFGQ